MVAARPGSRSCAIVARLATAGATPDGVTAVVSSHAFTRENITRGEIPAMHRPAAKASLAPIRSLVDGDLPCIFSSPDADAWGIWRRAPESCR